MIDMLKNGIQRKIPLSAASSVTIPVNEMFTDSSNNGAVDLDCCTLFSFMSFTTNRERQMDTKCGFSTQWSTKPSPDGKRNSRSKTITLNKNSEISDQFIGEMRTILGKKFQSSRGSSSGNYVNNTAAGGSVMRND